MFSFLKKLGPGLLFAGAAIGVSHLVQSTRAGADFGLGLLWALLVAHLFKYPFFQYGPRYAAATGESLLNGYKKLGKPVLVAYYILTFATMFTIQTAVTIVTAGIASSLFGDFLSIEWWTIVVLLICILVLTLGKYKLLDKLIKVIILVLTLSTIMAVLFAASKNSNPISILQILPENAVEITFLIAFMGWMPAPLDISIWHSLWALEKQKEVQHYSPKTALFDFNIGYIGTIILGIAFLLLGTLVMFTSNNTFSNLAGEFSNQLINMYTLSLGNWAYVIIGAAAFTTMFSTTLTTLDASPRAMTKTTELLFNKPSKNWYLIWILILFFGTVCIFFLLKSEMGLLVEIATVVSFLTAPFYAVINYLLITGKHTPKAWRPKLPLRILSWLGILFLTAFSIWYISILF